MIRFESVSFTHPGASRPVLRDLTFDVAEGELVVVVGATGVGKSTLLGAINGLVPHFTGGEFAGDVVVDNRKTRLLKPRDLADTVGYVGQDPGGAFVTDTVEDELAYVMEQLGVSPSTMRKRVEETLDLLGIAELRGRSLATLSAGQQQRVAIGSVLTSQPRVLVLDEPTSALDPTAAEDVLAAVARLVHDIGITVVLAEHRLERVVHHADRVHSPRRRRRRCHRLTPRRIRVVGTCSAGCRTRPPVWLGAGTAIGARRPPLRRTVAQRTRGAARADARPVHRRDGAGWSIGAWRRRAIPGCVRGAGRGH